MNLTQQFQQVQTIHRWRCCRQRPGLGHRGRPGQQFLSIGTGGTGGTAGTAGTAGTGYPVGGMVANAVSQPGKIVVTAQASNGPKA